MIVCSFLLSDAADAGSSLWPVLLAVLVLGAAALVLYFAPALRGPTRRILTQPAFVAAVVVLVISALGLNAATSFLSLHFKKLPVPLAVSSLSEGVPANMGTWVQVSKDEAIDPEVQQVLGTSQYVFRDYVDSAVWPDDVPRLKELSAPDRAAALVRLQLQKPQSILRVAVTYYTGMADTVAHIPERCYVGDGYEVSAYETKSTEAGTYDHGPNQGKPRNVEYRLVHFEDQTASRRVARDVAYLFHVNGKYESDSLAVRGDLQKLTERYGYYAKVELMVTRPMTDVPAAGEQLDATINSFLTAALPEIERCLPDWQALKSRAK